MLIFTATQLRHESKLTTGSPAEDDVVDAIGSTNEEHNTNETGRDIECSARDSKSGAGNELADSRVPRPLIVTAR